MNGLFGFVVVHEFLGHMQGFWVISKFDPGSYLGQVLVPGLQVGSRSSLELHTVVCRN